MKHENVRVEINLSALTHNLSWVKQQSAKAKCLAMVKADAYGHGVSVPLLKALDETDMFGVATFDEAQAIRQLGNQKPILVLQGFDTVEQLQTMAEQNMAATIHSDWQIDLFASADIAMPISIWLAFDTGMGRLGFFADQLASALTRLQQCNSVKDIVIMSHLACADDDESPLNAQQFALFSEHVAHTGLEKSLLSSAALYHFAEQTDDWIRPGLAIYGCSPFKTGVGAELGLKPVMTVSSRLLQVKHCRAGQTIGYGARYHCPEDMPIGIVAMGYADGFPREIDGCARVLVGERLVSVIGRVSMDTFVVDLRPCVTAKPGDTVLIWGTDNPIEQLAAAANTIPYTLLAGVGRQRAEYYYV